MVDRLFTLINEKEQHLEASDGGTHFRYHEQCCIAMEAELRAGNAEYIDEWMTWGTTAWKRIYRWQLCPVHNAIYPAIYGSTSCRCRLCERDEIQAKVDAILREMQMREKAYAEYVQLPFDFA